MEKSRGGFTLVELIFVIVIIAILVSLFYPVIMSNKEKANINAVVGNDAKLISGAITQWKSQSSQSKGNYNGISDAAIAIYLPNTMSYSGGYIHSSGLNGGIAYQVASDKITNDGDSIKIYVDFTKAINDSKFNPRIIQYAEKAAMDAFYNIATNKSESSKPTEDAAAKGLGNANSGFTDGGSTTDGKAGTRKIAF